MEISSIENGLVNLVNYEGYSSIEFLSDKLCIGEENVREMIKKLVAEGELQGSISSDGSRFYKSNVKVSTAPKIAKSESDITIETPSQKLGVYIIFLGIAIIATGILLPQFLSIDLMGGGVDFFIIISGFVALLSGLCYVSKGTTDIKMTNDNPV